MASPLPTCQSAEGDCSWDGPRAPDIPSIPLPWVPSPGTQYSSAVTGREKCGWGEPSNASAKQSLRPQRTRFLRGLRASHITKEGGGRGWRFAGAKRLGRTSAEHFGTLAHPCPKNSYTSTFSMHVNLTRPKSLPKTLWPFSGNPQGASPAFPPGSLRHPAWHSCSSHCALLTLCTTARENRPSLAPSVRTSQPSIPQPTCLRVPEPLPYLTHGVCHICLCFVLPGQGGRKLQPDPQSPSTL